ncbi:hypothetical protein FKP32DRAFT_1305632 [Trametes sanguinea]|nr:hypothetical protein FKP32DRAFT_1305632 [Trametes sanguinea]
MFLPLDSGTQALSSPLSLSGCEALVLNLKGIAPGPSQLSQVRCITRRPLVTYVLRPRAVFCVPQTATCSLLPEVPSRTVAPILPRSYWQTAGYVPHSPWQPITTLAVLIYQHTVHTRHIPEAGKSRRVSR